MHKLRITISTAALIFGIAIVGVSLTAVSPVHSAEGDLQASHRRVYFGETILPDHAVYPALMMMDRVELKTAPLNKKLDLQVEYSLRRLEYARQLIEKNEIELALTTLTKSQKYMLHAAEDVKAPEVPLEVQKDMLIVLDRYIAQVRHLDQHFSNSQLVAINELIDELEAAQYHLQLCVKAE